MITNSSNDEHDFSNYEEMDLKIINFIKMMNNKEKETIPDPTYFTISTQSAMCCMENVKALDLSKIVVHIAKNIIQNIILKQDLTYLIRGIVVDNLILRFDESYLKKYKKPFIKYGNTVIDVNNTEDILLMLGNIHILENNSLKKHGRQKNKKDNENFYNSCSIIVKAALDVKCVNIKLFNNGKITLTGAKSEFDGYNSSCVLLNEMKKEKSIFIDMNEEEINSTKISNYSITMINSDFNTNFKIDLLKFLTILNQSEKEIFTKFNPEKYRGLIIGYYWNLDKKIQDGKCLCKSKCNGKGDGKGDGKCKKITISIFKSGSIIITGGRLVKQIEDAYKSINIILKKNYHDIIKMSILDYIDDIEQDDIKNNDDSSIEDLSSILTDKKKKKSKTNNINENNTEKKIIKIKKIYN
jgi:TATA-box binding protein (TBP) (component of TFIID and TFIIIB)